MVFSGLIKLTLLDYPGKVACTLFLSGCNYRCPFCHNSDLVFGSSQESYSEREILDYLTKRQGILEGVCITGGEPTLYTGLEDFIKKSGINEERINYINEDQATISTLKSIISDKPTIVVTYSPYDAEIQKKGFIKIASTKDKFDLLVVDAMFTTKKVLSEHREQFEGLKKAVDRAVVELHKNPREFYEKVKPYILEIKYDEFRESLENIIWINESMSQKLKDRIKKEDFPIEDLI